MSVTQILADEYQHFLQKCQAIDLAPIANSFTQSRFNSLRINKNIVKLISRYFAFLYLNHHYSRIRLVPTREIDQIWQQHYLNSNRYIDDCQFLFGHVVPYVSYVNLYETDRPTWLRNYALTQVLFRKHFGIELAIGKEIRCVYL